MITMRRKTICKYPKQLYINLTLALSLFTINYINAFINEDGIKSTKKTAQLPLQDEFITIDDLLMNAQDDQLITNSKFTSNIKILCL